MDGSDPTTGQQSVEVWSATTQQSYTQICDDGGSGSKLFAGWTHGRAKVPVSFLRRSNV